MQVQEWMAKLNRNERMAVWGAVIVFVLSLLGTSWLTLIGAGAVIAIYWFKHSPTSNISWPAPVELINLAISGIIGLLALLGVLGLLAFGGFIGSFGLGMPGFGVFGGLYVIVLAFVIVNAVAAGMMVLGTWREYQAMPKSSPPPPPPPPAA